MRSTLYDIIPAAVRRANSLEEAIRIVNEEMAKGDCDCIFIQEQILYKRVKSEWQDKVNAERRQKIKEVNG